MTISCTSSRSLLPVVVPNLIDIFWPLQLKMPSEPFAQLCFFMIAATFDGLNV